MAVVQTTGKSRNFATGAVDSGSDDTGGCRSAALTIWLEPGLNLVSWLGPSGVTLADVARSVGSELVGAWAWDFEAQRFAVYSPLLPDALAQFPIESGGGLWLNIESGVTWRQTP